MRTLGFLVVVPLLAACRFGFQDQPDAQAPPPLPEIDAAVDTPPPPPVLACGSPARFPMAKAPDFVTATATATGYNLITSDASGVHGFAYNFSGNTLVAERGDVLLYSGATGELSTIANGEHSLVGVTNGTPLSSTSVIALDAQLGQLAAPATHDTWVGGLGSLARNTTGTLAFLGTKFGSTEVDAQPIADDGSASGPPHVVISDGSSPSIAASGADFLVTWNASTGTSSSIFAAVHSLTNESIVTKIPPQPISNDPINDAFSARGAYSAASDTYLFGWMQKPGAPTDRILISLRDHKLNELGGMPKEVGSGNLPIVVAGKDDYLVAWRIDAIRLGAARVKPDGSVVQVAIEGTSQEAIGMDLVVREGQPALVWVERDLAGGATVRFDPLCSP